MDKCKNTFLTLFGHKWNHLQLEHISLSPPVDIWEPIPNISRCLRCGETYQLPAKPETKHEGGHYFINKKGIWFKQ